MGADLLAAKDEKTGKVYVGVSYICSGIGLSESQKDTQVQKIQSDIVLQSGAKKLPLKFQGQVREVQCIDNEFIPLWLAKITITPTMQREHPEVADKLLQYQLKAQKVLADAFIRGKTSKGAPKLPSLTATTAAAKFITGLQEQAGVPATFQLMTAKNLFAPLGISIPTEGAKAADGFMDSATIADKLGILSKNKKPHEQAVAALIRNIGVKPDEVRSVPFQNPVSGHSDTHYQYAPSVVCRLSDWLVKNNRPMTIHGNGKNYAVFYRA